MSFAVVRNPLATERIDEAWAVSNSADRSQLEVAVVESEMQLRTDPMGVGESRDDIHERVFILPPLTLYFRVDRSNQIVRVVAARVYRSIQW